MPASILGAPERKHADVLLFQPLGVRDEIFPWGIHFIADYLEHGLQDATVTRILLQREGELADIVNRHADVGRKLLFEVLSKEAQRPFDGPAGMGAAQDLTIYCGWLGSSLIHHLKNHDCIAPGADQLAAALLDDIDGLHRLFVPELDRKLDRLLGAAPNSTPSSTIVCGISVYDRTLPFCIFLATKIKQRRPDAAILLGGDYFTFESAASLIGQCSIVDGVVVGYGEEAMRQVVHALQSGGNATEARIRGLVNRGSIVRPEPMAPIFPDRAWLKSQGGDQDRTQIVNVPVTYRPSAENNIKCVRADRADNLRVMFQRGCSYGECTFCTQIDKKLYYRLNQEAILEDLKHSVSMIEDQATLRISFDADEHAPQALLKILDFFCDDAAGASGVMFATLWFQAKYVTKRIIDSVARLKGRDDVYLLFIMNFESLNPETLTYMEKGHAPIQAIFSAKAIQDAGQFFMTNYMEYFPGEAEANVLAECKLLRSSLHLLARRVNLFAYSTNGRDDVYQNQARFGVRIHPLAKDFWLPELFGVSLPTSIWNYEFELEGASEVTLCWHRYLLDRSEANKVSFEEAAHRHGADGYLQRARDFAWLRSVSHDETQGPSVFQPSPISVKIVTSGDGKSSLHKDYQAATGAPPQTKPLAGDELAFLRYLYSPRSWSGVLAHFQGTVPEAALTQFRASNEAFGSLVEHDGLLLCTANDPSGLSFLQ